MYLAGGHFYTSGAFWSVAAGVIVGVLGIAATIWVTLRAADPKRRLCYWLLTDTPLITGRQDLPGELKVTYGVRALKSPRVVTVQIASRGRRDIAREAFDDGKPLCLDISTPIVECVKVVTSPSNRSDPAWRTDGSKLLIGPSHFGKRQTTVFSVLADGGSPRIIPPQQSLIDVSVERGLEENQRMWRVGIAGAVLFALWFGTVGATVALAPRTYLSFLPWLSVTGLVLMVGMAVVTWAELRRRPL